MYWWCAKCSKWTFTHGIGSHKTKEKLDIARNAAANIAQVSFEHHPVAYKVNGPMDFDGYKTTATGKHSFWSLAPILLVYGLTFGPDIYTLITAVPKFL